MGESELQRGELGLGAGSGVFGAVVPSRWAYGVEVPRGTGESIGLRVVSRTLSSRFFALGSLLPRRPVGS